MFAVAAILLNPTHCSTVLNPLLTLFIKQFQMSLRVPPVMAIRYAISSVLGRFSVHLDWLRIQSSSGWPSGRFTLQTVVISPMWPLTMVARARVEAVPCDLHGDYMLNPVMFMLVVLLPFLTQHGVRSEIFQLVYSCCNEILWTNWAN